MGKLMGSWFNWSFDGATSAQTDNAEVADNDEFGTATVTLPQSIHVTDVVLNITAAQTHQYRFYVDGKQVGANFYATQINPASDGRVSFADLGIQIPRGATIGLRGAQQSGSAVEATKVLVKYQAI
jgi:hypothetical protein